MADIHEPVIVTGSLTAVIPVKVVKARKGVVTVEYLGTSAELQEGDTVHLHATLTQ